MRVVVGLAVSALLLTFLAGSASGSETAFRRVVFARGFESPVLLTHAPGERNVRYVVEQPGRIIRLVGKRRTVFLDIRSEVDFGGERGLLGLAFHPNYRRNHLFYVAYTTEANNVVVRYRSGGGKAVPSSRTTLLSVPDPYANHNGGNLVVGPDKALYTSIGDGGSAGDPEDRAQNMNSPFGKLLRLDITKANAQWSIAALGLRNPWRFSFDPATGDLYIGDVGQGEIEEIDFTPRRSPGLENYGWDLFEGSQHFEDSTRGPGKLVAPIFEYHHTEGNCTVIGGYVYRGRGRPSERGRYILGDYCSGIIWSLQVRNGKAEDVRREPFRVSTLTSFGEDAAGEIYAVSGDGVIYRVT